MKTNILVIGSQDSGKTTLVNALAGWDILPQADDTTSFPTATFPRVPFGETHTLTDSPGYCLRELSYDPCLPETIAGADRILVLLSMGSRAEMERERRFLKGLLASVPEGRLFFVIPYASGDWPKGHPNRLLTCMTAFFGYRLPCFRVFCVDAMEGLIASIEDDAGALKRSGISRLREVLQRKE